MSLPQVTGSLEESLLNWDVGPPNKYILTDKKRNSKKMNYTYTRWKKTWPNNNLCTSELGMDGITAAQNVALKTTSGARDVPSPIQPQANQIIAEVLDWAVRSTSGGTSSKQMWLWKACLTKVAGRPIPNPLLSRLPLLWRVENLTPCSAIFPAARGDQANLLDKLKARTRLPEKCILS